MVIKFIINLCKLKVLNLRETSSYLANWRQKLDFGPCLVRIPWPNNPQIFLDLFCDDF